MAWSHSDLENDLLRKHGYTKSYYKSFHIGVEMMKLLPHRNAVTRGIQSLIQHGRSIFRHYNTFIFSI